MLLFQEIRQFLFELIGQKPALKKLPSERELVERFNSTRITVREALMRLEAEGTIYRQNRKGWFISPPRLKWDPVKKVNFYQLAKEQNFVAKTQLISINKISMDSEIVKVFNKDQSQDVFNIVRVRLLDERPVMIEEICCLADQFPALEAKPLEGSITTIFQQDYGVDVTHESSTLFVTAISDNKAELLNVNSGAACLKIIRKRFDNMDNLVDYNVEYWMHGVIEIEVNSK